MISISHWKKISKSKPTEVWCSDPLGEHLIKFDRLSLCSQIKAIPIEDVVAMLTEIQLEIEEMQCLYIDFVHYVNEYDVSNLIQQKINALKAESEG